jgi:hypothetical protein
MKEWVLHVQTKDEKNLDALYGSVFGFVDFEALRYGMSVSCACRRLLRLCWQGQTCSLPVMWNGPIWHLALSR